MYTGKIIFGVKTTPPEVPRAEVLALELLDGDRIRVETLGPEKPLTRKQLIELLNETLDYLEA